MYFVKVHFAVFAIETEKIINREFKIKNHHGILPLKFVCIINITNQKYLNESSVGSMWFLYL